MIVGLLLLVPESKRPVRAGGVDWFGAVLSALGFGGVVFGLIEGRTYGWLDHDQAADRRRLVVAVVACHQSPSRS